MLTGVLHVECYLRSLKIWQCPPRPVVGLRWTSSLSTPINKLSCVRNIRLCHYPQWLLSRQVNRSTNLLVHWTNLVCDNSWRKCSLLRHHLLTLSYLSRHALPSNNWNRAISIAIYHKPQSKIAIDRHCLIPRWYSVWKKWDVHANFIRDKKKIAVKGCVEFGDAGTSRGIPGEHYVKQRAMNMWYV